MTPALSLQLRAHAVGTRVRDPIRGCSGGWAILAILVGSVLQLPHPALAQETPPPARVRMAPVRAPTGVLVGVVRDDAWAPIHGAEVQLGGASRPVSTDEHGAFRFDGVPAGHARLSVRRLGFEPLVHEVEVSDSVATPTLELSLAALPTMLAPVRVDAMRSRYHGRLAGYYDRLERRNGGTFITREQIDREDPRLLSDAFGRIAGVSVGRGRMGLSTIRFRGRSCAPLVWLDGTPAPVGEVDLDAIAPQTVQGIELYLGSTSAPPQFLLNRDKNNCGTIVLWSRGPDTDAGQRSPRTVTELERLVAGRAVFTAADVHERAVPARGAVLSADYPPALFAARVAGTVVAEFVVSASGAVEPETFGIIASTHPLFSEAVERAVLATTFKAARRNELAVRQLVQLPFTFTPPAR